MKNIVIIPNTKKDADLSVTNRVAMKLVEIGLTPYVHDSVDGVYGCVKYTAFPTDIDLIVVVGGDGSVIDAARLAVANDIPLLGVNMGRIGYLSEVDPSDIAKLDKLALGDYYIYEKLLISVENNSFAVNDVVISHSDYLGVCDFRLVDSLGNSITYRADGIILSTPQGSTAYSLSAGGPIIAHNVDCISATPVCPHSFFNRTVLFNAREALTVTNTSNQAMNVSVDGRIYSSINPGESVSVTKSAKSLKMLSFSKNSMFNELFRKMSILEGLK